MENIERILTIMQNSGLPKGKHIYLLDSLTPENAKAHSDSYAHLQPDERMLFAFKKPSKGGKFTALRTFCVTDKYIHLCALDEKTKKAKGMNAMSKVADVVGEFSDVVGNIKKIADPLLKQAQLEAKHIPLDSIKSIELGENVFDGENYLGTHVLVNGEDIGYVEIAGFYDEISPRFIEYLFAAMSGNYSLNEFEEELQQYANAPEKQIKSNVGYLAYQVYTICSLGIFHLVQMFNIQRNLNTIASKYDGQTTQNYFKALLIGIPTFGIYWLVWRMRLLKRIEAEIKRRGIESDFSARKYWNHSVWGLLYVFGPIWYMINLLYAMNLLVKDYNIHG